MRLGFVGTGAITSAIVKGLAGSSLADWPVIVSPRSRAIADDLAACVQSVSIAANNQEVVDQSDMVFLAIRPQIAREVVSSLTFRDGQSVVSLVAGLSIQALESLIAARVDITRAIPLPSVETRTCATPILPANPAVAAVFDALGSSIGVPDAEAFDGYVAGSAVMATYFGIVEATVRWMQANGMNQSDADKYARNLFGNLGEVLRARPDLSLEQLRAAHTTIGGLNEMVHDRFISGGGAEALAKGLDAVLARVRS